MGCKSKTVFIEDRRRRSAAYRKRKQSLLRKASELSVLCDADVAAIIFPEGGRAVEAWPADPSRVLKRLRTLPPPRRGWNGVRQHQQQIALLEAEAEDSQTLCAALSDEADDGISPESMSDLLERVAAKLDEVRARLMVHEMQAEDPPVFLLGGGGDEIEVDPSFDPTTFLRSSFDMDSFMDYVNESEPMVVGFDGDGGLVSARELFDEMQEQILSLTWENDDQYVEAGW